ncbi:hypothetical protein KFK09_016543 [Dendrobium nobile]|uniref:Uncharacterized protein n=1 Tax=Dendrobium nobile TaxID=94219 RepID=A0A8T3B093_DENNO|nr:hypothetical protein KFK09_016543 [Dendrobium nobile]
MDYSRLESLDGISREFHIGESLDGISREFHIGESSGCQAPSASSSMATSGNASLCPASSKAPLHKDRPGIGEAGDKYWPRGQEIIDDLYKTTRKAQVASGLYRGGNDKGATSCFH